MLIKSSGRHIRCFFLFFILVNRHQNQTILCPDKATVHIKPNYISFILFVCSTRTRSSVFRLFLLTTSIDYLPFPSRLSTRKTLPYFFSHPTKDTRDFPAIQQSFGHAIQNDIMQFFRMFRCNSFYTDGFQPFH